MEQQLSEIIADIFTNNSEEIRKEIINEKITTPIIIDKDITQWNTITFKDCTFIKDLIFTDIKITSSLHFENCIFEENIIFESVLMITTNELQEDDIVFRDEDFSIEFSKCQINKFKLRSKSGIDNSYCNIEAGISFHSNTIIKSFTCYHAQIPINGLSFRNTIIKNSFYLSNVTKIDYVHFDSNCLIEGDFYIEKSVANNILFIDSTFDCIIKIEEVSVTNTFKINKSNFNKEFTIIQGEFITENMSQDLEINNSIFLKNAIIVYNFQDEAVQSAIKGQLINSLPNGFKKVRIYRSSFEENLQIASFSDSNRQSIDELKITLSSLSKGHILFNNLNVKNCILQGDNLNCHLTFSKIKFNVLKIIKLNNYGKINLNQCTGDHKGYILINESSLGNLKLLNFDFNTFEMTTIVNSTIQDITCTNVIWFNQNNFNKQSISKKNNYDYHRNNREIYKQLKYLTEKQLDRFQSLKFQQCEMMSYKNELKSIRSSKEDKIIMWANSINNFGQSWTIPAFYALIFTIIFWFLITTSHYYTLDINLIFTKINLESIISTYIYNFKNIFPMMNPIYNIKHIYSDIKPNFLINLYEFIHKLILSFFLYQTVTAFRKYVKQ